MTILYAQREDIPEIMRMSKTFYPLTGYDKIAPLDEETVYNLIEGLIEGHVLLVARESGKIVGLIGAFILPWMFNKHVLTAHEVIWWVDPEFRKSNIGMELKAGCEAEVKAMKAVAMQMPHFTHIPEAGKLYERSGYEHTESIFLKRF